MRAYSTDLRERVVAAVDGGMTSEQAATVFRMSVRTVERYLQRRRATGSLAPTQQRHGPAPAKKTRLQAWLPARLEQAADATLAEHAAAFTESTGVRVSLATMSRTIGTLPADDPGQAVTARGRARRPGRPLKSKA
jgi:transposase